MRSSLSCRRWITHSISDYYGLQSRSVLMGEPKRKVVVQKFKDDLDTLYVD